MHIVEVTPRFPPAIGGVEEHVFQISLELLRRGHEITIITSNEVDGKACNRRNELIQGMHIHRLPLFLPRKVREVWFMPQLSEVFRHIRGDIVHAHGYRTLCSFTAVSLAHFSHVPTVFTPHGIYPSKSLTKAILKSTFDYTLGRLTLHFSDRIIALSAHNVRLLSQLGASARKISIVPNGINIEEFENLRRSQRTLAEFDSKGPILLCVGRIDWNKQIERIVETMPLVLKEFPSAILVIVGPDYANFAEKLIGQARKLGVEQSVALTGSVSRKKLLDFYSMADVFVLPSSYEGFGLSMLEAMGSRVPVVVSQMGGPGDILTHRTNAWLLRKATPEEIFKATHAILTDKHLRKTIVENAFGLVRSRYTWKKVVDELEAVYKQAAIEKIHS